MRTIEQTCAAYESLGVSSIKISFKSIWRHFV